MWIFKVQFSIKLYHLPQILKLVFLSCIVFSIYLEHSSCLGSQTDDFIHSSKSCDWQFQTFSWNIGILQSCPYKTKKWTTTNIIMQTLIQCIIICITWFRIFWWRLETWNCICEKATRYYINYNLLVKFNILFTKNSNSWSNSVHIHCLLLLFGWLDKYFKNLVLNLNVKFFSQQRVSQTLLKHKTL